MQQNERMCVIPTLSYASGIAANDKHCARGPAALHESTWLELLNEANIDLEWYPAYTSTLTDPLAVVKALCKELTTETKRLTQQKKQFLVVGGDHSCAMGTWSGVKQSINGDLGLIWVDAHLDSHTFQTTHTHNIHGMPLAALLGAEPKLLTEKILLPENISIIGARSFESEEKERIEQLGIKVFYMNEIDARGIAEVFKDALALVQKNTAGFGLSFDLDAIDPEDAPAITTPEPHGIKGSAIIEVLHGLGNNPRFLGVEIVEYNPDADKHFRTEKLIVKIIQQIFSHSMD